MVEAIREGIAPVYIHDQRITLSFLIIDRQQERSLQLSAIVAQPTNQPSGTHLVAVELRVQMCHPMRILEVWIARPKILVVHCVFCKIRNMPPVRGDSDWMVHIRAAVTLPGFEEFAAYFFYEVHSIKSVFFSDLIIGENNR